MSGLAGMMGMGMDGMGMDSASSSMFLPTNQYITHIYWYLIIACVALGTAGNIAQRLIARQR
jgi:hypothetical protein